MRLLVKYVNNMYKASCKTVRFLAVWTNVSVIFLFCSQDFLMFFVAQAQVYIWLLIFLFFVILQFMRNFFFLNEQIWKSIWLSLKRKFYVQKNFGDSKKVKSFFIILLFSSFCVDTCKSRNLFMVVDAHCFLLSNMAYCNWQYLAISIFVSFLELFVCSMFVTYWQHREVFWKSMSWLRVLLYKWLCNHLLAYFHFLWNDRCNFGKTVLLFVEPQTGTAAVISLHLRMYILHDKKFKRHLQYFCVPLLKCD